MAGDSNYGAPGKSVPKKSAEVKEFSAAGRGKKCPICCGPVAVATRPFCSKRCSELDLGCWLREDYRLPAEETPDGGEEYGPESDENPFEHPA